MGLFELTGEIARLTGEMLAQGYMQRAFAAALLVGATCPAIGLFLVARRFSLIGEGLGHVSFAGIAAGMLAGLQPLAVAAAFAIAGALVMEHLRSRRLAGADSAVAVIFYGGIALGVVLASLGRNLNANLMSYLFGSIVTVTAQDLLAILALSLVVLGSVALLYPALLALVCDEELARVSGLPVDALNGLLAVLAALTVVLALRVVGLLLVSALLVVPVAAALPWARSFRSALLLSCAAGIGSAIAGLWIAYLLDAAAGGVIILVALALFGVGSALSRCREGLRREEPRQGQNLS